MTDRLRDAINAAGAMPWWVWLIAVLLWANAIHALITSAQPA